MVESRGGFASSGIRGIIPWNNWIVVGFSSIHGFFPSGSAETPFAAGFETDAAEIVAAGGTEVEEFAGQYT
jgi:hypothetical protein